jgi:hypothetical protein
MWASGACYRDRAARADARRRRVGLPRRREVTAEARGLRPRGVWQV